MERSEKVEIRLDDNGNSTYVNKREADICLNCPYPDCRSGCRRWMGTGEKDCQSVKNLWNRYFLERGVDSVRLAKDLGYFPHYLESITKRKTRAYTRTELECIAYAARKQGCAVTVPEMEAILSGYGFHAVASPRKPMEPVPVGSIKITAPKRKGMPGEKASDQWAMYFLGKGVSMEKLSLKMGRSQNYVFSIWRRKSRIYTRVELEEAEAVSGGAVLADEMEAVLVGAEFKAVETLNHGRKKSG